MIKLTVSNKRDLLLNATQIRSALDRPRGVGAEIIMIGGQRYQVNETAAEILALVWRALHV